MLDLTLNPPSTSISMPPRAPFTYSSLQLPSLQERPPPVSSFETPTAPLSSRPPAFISGGMSSHRLPPFLPTFPPAPYSLPSTPFPSPSPHTSPPHSTKPSLFSQPPDCGTFRT
eukprot:341621-Chlamydomonas_euryale.AAC.2